MEVAVFSEIKKHTTELKQSYWENLHIHFFLSEDIILNHSLTMASNSPYGDLEKLLEPCNHFL